MNMTVILKLAEASPDAPPIARFESPYTPAPGELIALAGQGYKVVRRRFSVDETNAFLPRLECELELITWGESS